jgi:serine/threonine-protein kinase
LSAVDHENIVSVTHLGHTADGRLFVVMELLEGENLGDRLARQRLRAERGIGSPWLPDEEVRAFVPQVLSALSTAHRAGVVHRDLKPDNLFVATKGDRSSVKVVDFGISKFQQREQSVELTQTGQILGTPLYMAPEQGKSTATVDARADIYSFGCIVYQMLTGRPPFVADSVYECVVMHATEDATPPSAHRAEIGPDLDALVLRCLEKRPDDRVQSADDLLSAWKAVWGEGTEGDLAILADTASRMRARRMPDKSSSRRTGLLVGGALALAGLAWLAGIKMRDGDVNAEPAGEPAVATTPTAEIVEAPPAPTPAPAEAILRHLASDPPGAEVYEDEESIGTTPLTLEVPPEGTRTVALRLRGYTAATATLSVDGPSQIVVSLERAAARSRRAVPKLAPR